MEKAVGSLCFLFAYVCAFEVVYSLLSVLVVKQTLLFSFFLLFYAIVIVLKWSLHLHNSQKTFPFCVPLISSLFFFAIFSLK